MVFTATPGARVEFYCIDKAFSGFFLKTGPEASD